MQKGINEIEKKSAEVEAMASGNRIQFLSLKDKEIVYFRWLTTAEDLIKARIHTQEEMTPKGKRYPKIYCTLDDLGACEGCTKGIPFKTYIYLWAWVYNIYHANQNPRLNEHPEQENLQWKPVKLPGDQRTYFKQEVNGPMIFKITPGAKNVYQNLIIKFSGTYGSLNDRDYQMSRAGGGLDTTYTIMPVKEGPLPAGAVGLDLPDLGEVIKGKKKTFGDEASVDGNAPANAEAPVTLEAAVEEDPF